MTINDIKTKLETSSNPVAQALHSGSGFRVLLIAFKKGMILKEHKAHMRSKLAVLEGSVKYAEAGRFIDLSKYDEIDIPLEIMHSVEALEDSLCILTQGD
jgi:quercetin dioxygenase-like cupin family protein